MQNGIFPHVFDARDHSLFGTFPEYGNVTGALQLLDYTFDNGTLVPNQDITDMRFNPPLPALPWGCTGETSTRICGDEDKCIYDPKYTYDRSCEMEGHGADQGCQIRTSMGSLTVYGLRKDGETQMQAQARKRGRYFVIEQLAGRDWFDSFRLALRGNKRGISVGIPWVPEFFTSQVSSSGLVANAVYDGVPTHYAWHDIDVCGEKTINGEPTLIFLPWQGDQYGDNGRGYITRAAFNAVFDNYGTIGATPGNPVQPQDVVYIKATIYQQALIYLNMILALIGKQKTIYA